MWQTLGISLVSGLVGALITNRFARKKESRTRRREAYLNWIAAMDRWLAHIEELATAADSEDDRRYEILFDEYAALKIAVRRYFLEAVLIDQSACFHELMLRGTEHFGLAADLYLDEEARAECRREIDRRRRLLQEVVSKIGGRIDERDMLDRLWQAETGGRNSSGDQA